jgi:hypothetical protein
MIPNDAYTDGWTVVYCTFDINGGYYVAKPGCFYLCDCTDGDLHFKVAPSSAVPWGSSFAAKIVGGAGSHQAYFQPQGGDAINGLAAGVSLQQSGQGRIFTSGAPSGTAAGAGWMSQ